MIRKLRETFLSNTRALEALYVMKGMKPVSRMCFSENHLPEIRRFCEENNLAMEESDYKVQMNFSGSYSTKGTTLPMNSQIMGHVFTYISRKQKLAERAKQAEKIQDVTEFGRLLGYPECCIAFFKEHKPLQEIRMNDYVVPAIHNSKGHVFSYRNNVFGRHFDMVLLNHCPCSFECKNSQKLAEKHEKLIAKTDPDFMGRMRSLLKCAVIYTGDVHVLHDYAKKDGKLTFLRVNSTKENDLHKDLTKNKELFIKDSLVVGGKKYPYPLLLFE